MLDYKNNLEQFHTEEQKKSSKLLYSFYTLVVLAVIFFLFFVITLSRAYDKNGSNKTFVIAKGERPRVVASELKEQKLISNTFVFNVFALLSGRYKNIQTGEFILSQKMDMKEILAAITSKPKKDEITLRIKEGWTLDEIEKYLVDNKVVAQADFDSEVKEKTSTFTYFNETPRKKSLEGYLFPDTYFVKKNATPNQILDRLLNTMSQRLNDQMRKDIAAQGRSIYDVLTLASIIEREVGRNTSSVTAQDLSELEQERKIVAGIFMNRLNIGMALQSDATVNYVTKKKDPTASYADISIDSPYNTYKYPGLPIGPISNPSLSSIEAAVYPAKTDYLYFLTKPDGTAVFSRTAEEHSANKQRYLK